MTDSRPPSLTRVWSRPHMNERTISQIYQFQEVKSENLVENARRYIKKNYSPSPDCLKRFIDARIPSVKWLRQYKIRQDLLKDIIGGITMGIIEVPQSMAYSLMAGLPAVNGLYVAFFSAMMYFFFGTSRHLSVGTYGIVSIMLDTYMVTYEGRLFPAATYKRTASLSGNASSILNSGSFLSTLFGQSAVSDHLTFQDTSHILNGPTLGNGRLLSAFKVAQTLQPGQPTQYLSNNREEAKVMLAMAFSFYTGLFHIVFGILHLGVATRFLSDTVVAAFTTGAAYHLVASELYALLGVKTVHTYGFFKIIGFLIELFTAIRTINLATCIISAVCLFELYMVKHFINHKYRTKMIAPVPIEFIVITLATLFSYLFRFEERYGVKVVGEIPLGFPIPKAPPLSIFPIIYLNVIELAIVSFALNISMAKVFAKKHKYKINPNQEFFAYGIGNLLNSFFRGFPSSVGISRCTILDDIGVRSLLHSFISSMILMVVIVGIGFLVRHMPIACLASLIVAALIPLLGEVRQVVPLFKRSKIEGVAWAATFGSVVIFDVDFGLYIGIAFALLLFILQKQRAFSFVMGNIPDTDIYEAINICEQAVEIEGIKIIRYESSIFYANVDNFVYRMFKLVGINPNEELARMKKLREKFENKQRHLTKSEKPFWLRLRLPFRKNETDEQTQTENSENELPTVSNSLKRKELEDAEKELEDEIKKIMNSIKIKDIIVDFSCVNLIDTMGLDAVLQMMEAYKQIGIQMHFSHCKRNLIKRFNKSPFRQHFSYDFIYPTTHDAVLNIIFSRTVSELGSGGDMDGERERRGAGVEGSLHFDGEYASMNIGLDPTYYAKREDDEFNIFETVVFEV